MTRGLTTFASAGDFRAWLAENHDSVKELVVRCYKTKAAKRGLAYRQALDEALCFGWIDGVRRSVDERSFSVRFTPRKSKSYWSAVNIRRATQLKREGRMHPAGQKAFSARETKTGRYSFETKPRNLDRESEKRFKARPKAWRFFRAQAPWYQRTSIFWVMQAKREETRARRLAELIASSVKGEPIRLLARAPLR